MSTTLNDDPRAALRRGMYLVLMAIGLGAALGRILAVDAVDRTAVQEDHVRRELADAKKTWNLRRPFLSANDRSRWCTVRALVEPEMRVPGAPYAIDRVIQQPNWDTIDMVKHDGHLYSSKPPLLPTLMAAEYWLLYRLAGWSLAGEPFLVGRIVLVTLNGGCLLLYFLAMARLVERLGTTDWGRLFVMAAAVGGTFVTTFAVVINNHLVGAACAAVALEATLRIWLDGDRRLRWFVVAGLAAALLAGDELPALALAVPLSLIVFWKAPGRALLGYLPPVLLVAAVFFGSNWIAHHSLIPAYLHQHAIVLEPVDAPAVLAHVREARGRDILDYKEFSGFMSGLEDAVEGGAAEAVLRSGRQAVRGALLSALEEDWIAGMDSPSPEHVAAARKGVREAVTAALEEIDLKTERPDNWYDYAYQVRGQTKDSYWRTPVGVDRGERSVGWYAFNVLVGHHGIFSLTPLWLMSLCGTILWLRRGQDRRLRGLAALVAVVSLVCLAFYLLRPTSGRNYGGMNTCFRWVLWMAPMWLAVMLPTADAVADHALHGKRRWPLAMALVLLAVSALSAHYATWNPWTNPWIVDLMKYLGFA